MMVRQGHADESVPCVLFLRQGCTKGALGDLFLVVAQMGRDIFVFVVVSEVPNNGVRINDNPH